MGTMISVHSEAILHCDKKITAHRYDSVVVKICINNTVNIGM